MSANQEHMTRARRRARAGGIAIDLAAPLAKQPSYLTMKETAALLRRSVRALNRWESLGLLRVIRPAGGNPLIERTEIERILFEGSAEARGKCSA